MPKNQRYKDCRDANNIPNMKTGGTSTEWRNSGCRGEQRPLSC